MQFMTFEWAGSINKLNVFVLFQSLDKMQSHWKRKTYPTGRPLSFTRSGSKRANRPSKIVLNVLDFTSYIFGKILYAWKKKPELQMRVL